MESESMIKFEEIASGARSWEQNFNSLFEFLLVPVWDNTPLSESERVTIELARNALLSARDEIRVAMAKAVLQCLAERDSEINGQ